MSQFSFLLGISTGIIVLSTVFLLLFSWITVRKLKKNTETKKLLGFEFISGWNILNAAQALSLPRIITNKLKNSPGSFLYADADALYQHTNKFDKFLARLFYWTCVPATISLLILIILDEFNFFT